MIGGKIWTENTKFRQSISPSIRLAATLRFLASGDSFTSLMYTCRISKQAISQFVPEVYEAIISALQKFMKVSEKNIYKQNQILPIFFYRSKKNKYQEKVHVY
jgi:hypothetical protein